MGKFYILSAQNSRIAFRFPYHIGVDDLWSHTIILRGAGNLQSNLYESSRKVMNKYNLSESCLKNRLQMPFAGS